LSTLGGTIPDPSHDACTTVVAKGPELDCLVRVMTATVAWCGVACTGASRVCDDLFICCVCSFLPTWGGLRARPTNINTSSTIDTTTTRTGIKVWEPPSFSIRRTVCTAKYMIVQCNVYQSLVVRSYIHIIIYLVSYDNDIIMDG